MVGEDRRDPNNWGRRQEDERWLKVQEQIMNLVTAERTDQQELGTVKQAVLKLSDHVEDLDDYLRGVAGDESLDNRVVLLERESTGNSVLLRQIKRQIEDLKDTVSNLKISSAVSQVSEEKHLSKLIKFWLPIILASIGLLIPLTKLAIDKIHFIEGDYRPDERLRRQIEEDKKRRGKMVQKRLQKLEQIQEMPH